MWKRGLKNGGRPGDLISISRQGRRRWRQPADMPIEVAFAVVHGRICGAKKKDGGWCHKTPSSQNIERYAPLPHRCKFHGGESTGEPGNSNARTHGLYAKSLSLEEAERFDSVSVVSLEDEIRLTKTRLARATRLERLQDTILESDDPDAIEKALRLYEIEVKDGTKWEERTVRRIVNYKKIINDIVSQLTRLTQQQLQLMSVGADETGETIADEARARIAEFDLSFGLVNESEEDDDEEDDEEDDED